MSFIKYFEYQLACIFVIPFTGIHNKNSVVGTVITPSEYLGPVMSLCIERRGMQRMSTNIDNDRIMLQYDLPLCEIVLDFHDILKSITSGYASFDYEDNGFTPSAIVKVSKSVAYSGGGDPLL